jgi:tRNA-dihydrouridine synthase A
MMAWTNRPYRRMMRKITRRTLLYTEMVTVGALLHGDAERHLDHHADEHPVALQLGGDQPADLAEAARMADAAGFDEINLNVGCPSDRVQRGRFGACLMAEPEQVKAMVAAMKDVTSKPITVKHRIGIDHQDDYRDMLTFVDTVAQAGADRFTVHARKAWLQGLSPKENRTVPPLKPELVHRLKQERPDLQIEINGGVLDLSAAQHHLNHVDAVMIGRAAYERPLALAGADSLLFGEPLRRATPRELIATLMELADEEVQHGASVPTVVQPMLGLFRGQPGARRWRQVLGEEGRQAHDPATVLRKAAGCLNGDWLDQPFAPEAAAARDVQPAVPGA